MHGGRLVAQRLKAHGVTKLFTLSGGHLFSIYDGCREEGIEIVDMRHEQTAAFAAEGWAKATREPGVRALTAGPGRDQRHERDGVGAAERLADRRARRARAGDALGAGLAPGDRPRAVRRARSPSSPRTAGTTAEIPGLVDEALRVALRAADRAGVRRLPARPRLHGGRARTATPAPSRPARAARPPTATIDRAAELLRAARAAGDHGRHRPLLGRAASTRCARSAEELSDPGVPQRPGARLRAGRPRAVLLARARRPALKGADVALVIGVPMDFRLGFGGSFGEDTRDRRDRRRADPSAPHPRAVAAELYGGVAATLDALRERRRRRSATRSGWVARAARGREREARRPSRRSSTTSARRCTRCASTASSRRCSTATRS